MTDDEKFIRDCAARRLTQQQTAELMGTTRYKLRLRLETITPKIEWAGQGYSITFREALIAKNQAAKGTERAAAICDKARAVLLAKCQTYTAFGVTARLPELVERFGVIHINSVRKRLKEGLPIEEALTMAPRKNTDGLEKGREIWRSIINGQITAQAERREYGHKPRQQPNF